MRTIGLAIQTMFAELAERCRLAESDRDFPAGGSFSKRERNGRQYWYFHGYDAGKKYSRYVGPDSDALRARINHHGRIKRDYRERCRLVSLLRRAGLPAPPDLTGDLLAALAAAGLFRLRACVVGTVAYHTYGGLLGVILPRAQLRTLDLDIAQFHGISVTVEDSVPSIFDVLRSVDASFRPVPRIGPPTRPSAFVNDAGYRVEFLTPNRGPNDRSATPLRMPALGGATAQPLRFLDFLIRDEIPTVVLHDGGIAVNVPSPARYAVHKLIVATRRREGAAKIDKDIAQAATLIEALTELRRPELADAWSEAYRRGPKCRKALAAGMSMLPEGAMKALKATVG